MEEYSVVRLRLPKLYRRGYVSVAALRKTPYAVQWLQLYDRFIRQSLRRVP